MNDKTQGAANPGFGAGLGAFVPGFDFLQKLAAGQVGAAGSSGNAGPASLADWIAPTLNVKVLEQRIAELKAVQFWLEQNAAALKATLQALEVQKMTLAALQGMGGAGGAGGANQADAAEKKAAPESMHAAQAMQYWTALTQQFQTIAAQAMKDMAAMKPPAATAPSAAQKTASPPESRPESQSEDAPPKNARANKASSAKATRSKAGKTKS